MANDQAAYMRQYRMENPDVARKQKISDRARRRAQTRLAAIYLKEFRQLYNEELEKIQKELGDAE